MNEIIEKANYCLNCKIKPCQKGCPLGNDIPAFISSIKEEKYEEAYKILSKTTVLQPICGRICPHMSQCQGKCVRGIKGKPTTIGELEAFVGDKAIKEGYNYQDEPVIKNGKKVAIIGGGSAGLTCGAFLARKGYEVTIYEKHDKLGGILQYGIPEFRLNRDALEGAIDKIIDLGIEVKYNKELGKDFTLKQIEDKYDAVFLSFGANIPLNMKIDGENLNGVYGANSLLEIGNHPNYDNKKVAVIGGGNVAMDAARTVKRLGAKEVYIIYRRTQEQMPAEKEEIEAAKQEGIEFLFQNNIVKILSDEKGNVSKIECIKTELVQTEEGTRPSPVNIENSNYLMDMDYVIMAIGSKVEENVANDLELELDSKGYIKTNENYQTSNKKIFAGGDLIGQKQTVAWAASSGRKAAEAIDMLLYK